VVDSAGSHLFSLAATWQTLERRAAEDVARHGLRACALPGCGATEPRPKTFKVCGRCRRACYCSAAHQAADWPRYKREDGGRMRRRRAAVKRIVVVFDEAC
jgi:hypothetical protein